MPTGLKKNVLLTALTGADLQFLSSESFQHDNLLCQRQQGVDALAICESSPYECNPGGNEFTTILLCYMVYKK